MDKPTETAAAPVKRGPGRPRKVAAPDPPRLATDDPNRVIDLHEAAQICGCSERSIKRLEKRDPDFPKPFRIGGRLRNWLYGDVRAYVLKKAGKGQNPAT
jgi:predicted DNA-binding transcriptional regulator AlpA